MKKYDLSHKAFIRIPFLTKVLTALALLRYCWIMIIVMRIKHRIANNTMKIICMKSPPFSGTPVAIERKNSTLATLFDGYILSEGCCVSVVCSVMCSVLSLASLSWSLSAEQCGLGSSSLPIDTTLLCSQESRTAIICYCT